MFVNKRLAPALAGTGVTELRTQTFLPWIEKLWDTPNVAHDNPRDQRFHASVMLGFTDSAARDPFFAGDVIHDLSNRRPGSGGPAPRPCHFTPGGAGGFRRS